MAEDFHPNKLLNTSKNCNQSSDLNLEYSSLGYSASSSDWSLTQSCSGGIAEPSLHSLLQEDLNKRNFFWQEFEELNKPISLTASDINLMQFTNTSSFWNASAGFYHSSVSPIATQFSEAKPCFTSLTAKVPEGPQEKKSSSESVPKKARVETLPPFKVRKEKLGDRITALQQLVSPFGKTDTASVLHEAIEYIKFLQDQVSVLSSPYLINAQHREQQKNSGKLKKREDSRLDLKSRGLCLVPIASTYTVTSEANSDLWTQTFGGTYN